MRVVIGELLRLNHSNNEEKWRHAGLEQKDGWSAELEGKEGGR